MLRLSEFHVYLILGSFLNIKKILNKISIPQNKCFLNLKNFHYFALNVKIILRLITLKLNKKKFTMN